MTFIKQYTSLVRPSSYSFQETDVCIIDLNKVTQDTGAEGIRRTTIAYMVSRYLLGKDFLSNKDILDEMTPAAQQYYKSKVLSLEFTNAIASFSEFNRTTGAPRHSVINFN